MPDLTDFQDAFAAALAGDDAGLARWAPAGAPGLRVHRNTWIKGAIDALEANFPTVATLVGSEWFRAAAREFVLFAPPTGAALFAYGAGFAGWLAAFPPAAALPYLPSIALLDRLWLDALLAHDAEPVGGGDLARLDAEALERAAVRLHPSVRTAWFGDNSASLWLATRWPAGVAPELEFDTVPEGVVIARPDHTVRARIVGAAEFAFLDACARGRPLSEAARTALDAQPGADLAAILAAALEDGLFACLEITA
jgi:hypothetical protein